MLVSYFSAGLKALRARPLLALLLFALQLFIANILAIPIASVLQSATAGTGFDHDLASGLDFALVVDILRDHPTLLSTPIAMLGWIIPLLLVWKAALSIGLVHALRGDASGAFWEGVGRYGIRSVLLSLVYLAPILVWTVLVAILSFVVTLVFPGEVGQFWTWLVLLPTLFITGVSILDLMHDYSRMAIVVGSKPVLESFFAGLRFPFRHGIASWLYLLWFVPAALLLVIPTALEWAVGMGALVFIAQQIVLFGRSAVTVAWFGSEVALYESVAPAPEPEPEPEPEPGLESESEPEPDATEAAQEQP